MSQRVSKIALQCLKESSEKDGVEYTNIAYGDLDLLHDVFDRCNVTLKNNHPLNKHQYVLNALDRESKEEGAIFKKEYFRSYKGLARMFELNSPDEVAGKQK
jgi:hypothetical protein